MATYIVKMRRVIYEEYEVETDASNVVQAMDQAVMAMKDHEADFVTSKEGTWAPVSVTELK